MLSPTLLFYCHVYGDNIYVVTPRGGEGAANYNRDRK